MDLGAYHVLALETHTPHYSLFRVRPYSSFQGHELPKPGTGFDWMKKKHTLCPSFPP